ncbi:hypothetical protein SNE40_021036 [Patella caerulea]|uniref:Uncharacterized protein n=1 Tax=Patella caerulea TaxID=87958 RepID=A0AAN8G9C3_PATCE
MHVFVCYVLLIVGYNSLTATLAATTPVPQPCFCGDVSYNETEEPFYVTNCIFCKNCGDVHIIHCQEFCVDSEDDPDQCCPYCPNGSNCLAYGEKIPAGEPVQVGQFMCECQPVVVGPGQREASCVPLPPNDGGDLKKK